MTQTRKLKILHLTSHLDVGGITRYVKILGTQMRRQGHDVSVLSAGGGEEASFGQAGIRSHIFPVRKKNILDPSLYFPYPAILRLVRRERYDVLHAHTRVTQALAHFLGKKAKIPVVSTCHGYFKYKLGRKLLPFWGDRVVAISGPVAEDLQKTHHVSASKIRVIENAIDLDARDAALAALNPQEVRHRLEIPERAVVVSAVGRFVQDKGHEILIRAVAGLRRVHPEIFLLVAGNGREYDNLQRTARETGLSGHSLILNGDQDVAGILAATDIFVHPAFYREGFGLGIAEAMAAGKPVVITDIPAVNKIFRPGECSVMASPGDVESLEGAIRFLLEAPGEKKRIAEAGQKLVRSMCRPDRQADQMEALYRELVP